MIESERQIGAEGRTGDRQGPLEPHAEARCPRCGETDLRLEEGAIRCEDCERRAGVLHSAEMRVDWHATHSGQDLSDRVRGQAEKFDRWAKRIRLGCGPRTGSEFDSIMERWFQKTAILHELLRRRPHLKDLGGKRVLDVGGTCKDSWRFLAEGARRIDQVDVSSGSQSLGLRRLRRYLDPRSVEWRPRTWFHTVPVERLPFDDDVYDMVFSRATIHHTDREKSIPELHRVLKPGGDMVLIERWHARPMYALMRVVRSLRGERGADDPLRTQEIHRLGRMFSEVDWRPGFTILSFVWGQTLGRYVQRDAMERCLRRFDRRRAGMMGLSRTLGNYCWIYAKK